jgi:hypothetical protein
MKDFQTVLMDLEIRRENVRTAVSLGFFGTNDRDVYSNLRDYNIANEDKINQEINEMNAYFDKRGVHVR